MNRCVICGHSYSNEETVPSERVCFVCLSRRGEDSHNPYRSIAIIPVYAEYAIGSVITKFTRELVDELCLIVDAPDPKIMKIIKKASAQIAIPVKIICNRRRNGIGAAIRRGLEYALSNNFGIAVVMAGNGKDDPVEIPRLLRPIITEGCDYIQGSRYLQGGRAVNTPLSRRIITRMFPLVWRVATRFRCTDVTNGFRAYMLNIFRDKRVDISQKWLDGYALEYYMHYKALTLGYKAIEVPVSKVYRKGTKYTKISPFRHWWQIAGPLVTLRLGLRR